MANPTGKGGPKKGEKRNPLGIGKEAAQQRRELHEALMGDALEIQAALMKLVRKGNVLAVKYAHELVYGKQADKLELSGSLGRDPLEGWTPEDALELAAIFKAKRLAASDDGGVGAEGLREGMEGG